MKHIIFFLLIFTGIAYTQKNWGSMHVYGYDNSERNNIISVEVFGNSGIAGIFYERVIPFKNTMVLPNHKRNLKFQDRKNTKNMVVLRLNAGLTPFYMTEKYEFKIAENISVITGVGLSFLSGVFRFGFSYNIIQDYFFQYTPESPYRFNKNGIEHYKVRTSPQLNIELHPSKSVFFRGCFHTIIDPINGSQTETHVTPNGSLTFGIRF